MFHDRALICVSLKKLLFSSDDDAAVACDAQQGCTRAKADELRPHCPGDIAAIVLE
jgi:hypothetical protein